MFNQLVGNDNIKQIMRRMLAARRVPGSLIFAGIAGVGKRRFAFELAKAMLCRNPRELEACEKCASCLRVNHLDLPKSRDKDDNEQIFFTQHPDVGFLRPAGRFLTVAQIRQLQTEAVQRPFETSDSDMGARFFIVDEADKMNEAAANSLLKTLEEPPATTHLVLITARPDALLQTIRSRCQILRFAPVAVDKIETHLSNDKRFSPNDIKLLARVANGSIGAALSLDLEKYKQQREQMFGALEALSANRDRSRLLRIAEELNDAKIKDEYETRLETLQILIHDVWTLKLNYDKSSVVNVDLLAKLEKTAQPITSPQLQAWLIAIERLRENLAVNVNRKIATDALFLQMANA